MTIWSVVLQQTGGKIVLMGKAGGWFFQLKNWPFAVVTKKFSAAEQPILVGTNSVQMIQPYLQLTVGCVGKTKP